MPMRLHGTYRVITTLALTLKLKYPDLEGLVDARQKLESQQQENQGVQSEFASLDEESNIYKLVGPVLLKQDKTEANMAVNGRLEFIEKEMYVTLQQVDSTRQRMSECELTLEVLAANESRHKSRKPKRKQTRNAQR